MKELNLQIAINYLGMGMHGLGYYKVLKQQGIKVNLHPIVKIAIDVESFCQDFELNQQEFEEDLARGRNPDVPELIVWHPGFFKKLSYVGNKKIGCTVFETDFIRPFEVSDLAKLDKVYTTNYWGQDVLNEHDLPSDGIMPGPAWPLYLKDIPSESKLLKAVFKSDLKEFENVGLSIGKFEKRKAIDRTIKTFTNCAENSLLIGLWNNPFDKHSTHVLDFMQGVGNLTQTFRYKESLIYTYKCHTNTVICLPHLELYKEVLALYRHISHYITFSYGEGWDLPLVDAMGMKKTALYSHNTAHKTYGTCNSSSWSCYPEKAHDNLYFKEDRGCWFITQPLSILMVIKNLKTNHKNNGTHLSNIKDLCDSKVLAKTIMDLCYDV
jgi:hypothetical protein